VFTAIALGPKEICGIIVGDGCGKPYNPWEQVWTVTFPNVSKPSFPKEADVPKVSYLISI